MQLKIISWNIRHFRQDKIDNYIKTLWEVCNWAHVVFIYEDHTGLGSVFAQALNNYEQRLNKARAHWSGDHIYCSDEFVSVIWRSPLAVTRNTGVEAGISALIPGERAPAVVDIRISIHSAVTVAAWHAFGPAKVGAKDVFQRMLRISNCDILIGDFNFQSFDPSHRPGDLAVEIDAFNLAESTDFQVGPAYPVAISTALGMRSVRLEASRTMQEILPMNHAGSTTYTQQSIGGRTTGLDRCLVKKQHVAAVQMCVAQPQDFSQMFLLTDHMPLMLILEVA